MTLSTIILHANKYLDALIGDPVDEFFIKEFINKGYVDGNRRVLAYEKPFSGLTTVASTRTVALPSDCLKVRDIFYSGKQLDWKDINMIDMGNSTAGTPNRYSVRASTLVLEPIPVGNVTMTGWYFADVTALAAPTDEPVWEDAFHRILIDYAIYEGLLMFGKPQAANSFRDKYEKGLMDMASFYDKDRSAQNIIQRRSFERQWDKG